MIEERKKLFTRKTVDGNQELDYLDSMIPRMSLDTVSTYTIKDETAFRPDLVAYRFFGNFNLGWLILIHNNIIDPFDEFSTGTTINIPDIEQFYSFYNRNS